MTGPQPSGTAAPGPNMSLAHELRNHLRSCCRASAALIVVVRRPASSEFSARASAIRRASTRRREHSETSTRTAQSARPVSHLDTLIGVPLEAIMFLGSYVPGSARVRSRHRSSPPAGIRSTTLNCPRFQGTCPQPPWHRSRESRSHFLAEQELAWIARHSAEFRYVARYRKVRTALEPLRDAHSLRQ